MLLRLKNPNLAAFPLRSYHPDMVSFSSPALNLSFEVGLHLFEHFASSSCYQNMIGVGACLTS